MKTRISLIMVLVLVLASSPSIQCQTIKLGTLAPDGSKWYLQLRNMGEKWKDATNGQVIFRIYSGGVVGDEVDVPPYLPVKNYPGAKCAVTQIEKLADIGAAWEHLYQWVEEHKDYEHAHMDGLEQVLSPLGTPEEQYSFKLYLPVS